MMHYFIGAIFGLLCLLPFLKSPSRSLAMNAYLALAMMISIYLGAWLVSGDFQKIVLESILATIALGVATVFRVKWPLGVAILVLAHGTYDHFLGAASGVAEWYPPVCAGFDVVVGSGLILLMLRNSKQEQLEQK